MGGLTGVLFKKVGSSGTSYRTFLFEHFCGAGIDLDKARETTLNKNYWDLRSIWSSQLIFRILEASGLVN